MTYSLIVTTLIVIEIKNNNNYKDELLLYKDKQHLSYILF